MDTVVVPRVAVGEAMNETVTVHVGLHPLLVKVAVTPVGSIEVTEKVTGVVTPAVRVAVIIEDGLVLPWATERLLGEGVDKVNAKVVGEMVSMKLVVANPVLDVPVTVIVVVPVVAVGVAVKVAITLQTLTPPLGAGVHVGGFGVKTTLTPLGRADRLKVTGAGTPAVRVADRISVPDMP